MRKSCDPHAHSILAMIIVTSDAGNSEHRGSISEQGKFGNSEHRGNSEHILIPRLSEIISAGAEKTAWHLLLTCAETEHRVILNTVWIQIFEKQILRIGLPYDFMECNFIDQEVHAALTYCLT